MLRFCGEEQASLVNCLFEIEITPNDGKFDVVAKQLFPDTPLDQSLIKNIQLFSFPDFTAIESNCFFHFAIGDTAVDFQIGFVLYNTSFNALCLVSNYYYPDLFKFVLESYRDDTTKLISVMNSLSTKQVRHSATLKGQKFELDGGRERQKLLSIIFRYFSPYDISKIVIGMLQARHIYVISARASLCSEVAAGLSLLIRPLRWDMNTIPVLPMQLRDAAQVPVPTLIGLTSIEILTEGSLSAHLAVNLDLGVVIDNPPLEAESPQRLRIMNDQISFHKDCLVLLAKWKGCPGFPHLQVSAILRRFVFQYLQVYLGDTHNRDEFFRNLPNLPDYLDTSQVLNDLKDYSNCPEDLKDCIEQWLAEMFDGIQPRASATLISAPPLQQQKSSPPLFRETPPKPKAAAPKPAEPVADLLNFGDSGQDAAPRPKPSFSATDNPFALFEERAHMPAKTASTPNFAAKQDDLLGLFDAPDPAPQSPNPTRPSASASSTAFGSPAPAAPFGSPPQPGQQLGSAPQTSPFGSPSPQKSNPPPSATVDDLLSLF